MALRQRHVGIARHPKLGIDRNPARHHREDRAHDEGAARAARLARGHDLHGAVCFQNPARYFGAQACRLFGGDHTARHITLDLGQLIAVDLKILHGRCLDPAPLTKAEDQRQRRSQKQRPRREPENHHAANPCIPVAPHVTALAARQKRLGVAPLAGITALRSADVAIFPIVPLLLAEHFEAQGI